MCITFYWEATTSTIRGFLKAFPCKQLKNVCLKFLGPLFAFTSTTFYNATFISKPSSLKTSVSVNNTKPNSLIVAENAVQASSSSSRRRHNNLNGAVRRTKKPLQHSNSVFSAAERVQGGHCAAWSSRPPADEGSGIGVGWQSATHERPCFSLLQAQGLYVSPQIQHRSTDHHLRVSQHLSLSQALPTLCVSGQTKRMAKHRLGQKASHLPICRSLRICWRS